MIGLWGLVRRVGTFLGAVRLGARLRGETPGSGGSISLSWDDPHHDRLADIQQAIRDADTNYDQALLAEHDPEHWEDCVGLNEIGLCPQGFPIYRHVIFRDGLWRHPRVQEAVS